MSTASMQTRRAFALAGLLALLIALPAQAERDHPIYEGLLPLNFQMQEGAPLTAADLAGKHVVLVPSANFNAWAARWEQGQSNRIIAEDTRRDALDATDPHKVSDRMAMLLASYAAQVTAANDLASAHAQGADYIGVLDFRISSSFTGGARSVRYGLHMLDAALHHVLSSVQTGQGQYHDPGLFAGLNQTIVASDAAIAEATRQAADMLSQDIARRLGPPPAANGENHAE